MTYTWENIEAEIDVVEGSCRKKQTTKKRILDHGRKLQVSKNSFLSEVFFKGLGPDVVSDKIFFNLFVGAPNR